MDPVCPYIFAPGRNNYPRKYHELHLETRRIAIEGDVMTFWALRPETYIALCDADCRKARQSYLGAYCSDWEDLGPKCSHIRESKNSAPIEGSPHPPIRPA